MTYKPFEKDLVIYLEEMRHYWDELECEQLDDKTALVLLTKKLDSMLGEVRSLNDDVRRFSEEIIESTERLEQIGKPQYSNRGSDDGLEKITGISVYLDGVLRPAKIFPGGKNNNGNN